jgi:hypothetical protein
MSNDRQLKDEAGPIQAEVQEENTIEATRTDLSGDAVAEISGFYVSCLLMYSSFT